VTQVTRAALSGLPGAVATATVVADLATRELSVVVEGADHALSVRLLDPLGALAASGGALLEGSGISGLDALPAVPGVYSVQVIDPKGGARAVEISVAKTVGD
jgi:hypothetical protein